MRRAAVVVAVLVAAAAAFEVLVAIDTQAFRAKSQAMAPTIDLAERFDVNRDAYDDAAPERGDIVVFHPPQAVTRGGAAGCGARLCERPARAFDDDATFVMRVIGLPDETVAIDVGGALIDGEPLDEPYADLGFCRGAEGCRLRGEVTVPDGHYYVMGDNRGAADDSRFWGPVPRDEIVGRVDDCWPLGLKCAEDDRTG